MLIKHNIVALLAFSFMASATAAEFSIGAGAVYNESPYRGYNDNVHAVPLVSYESESFYFRQTTLGYILSKEGANKRGNSSRLTQSFHFFMFEPIF
ncbi:MipA/OmpV family protein, partial [Citrobacter freundii]|uniref:MipA/OmpV family protein n=1 Tax=Citrobacter freundii TaxID=546 RepID=UPI0035E3D9D8